DVRWMIGFGIGKQSLHVVPGWPERQAFMLVQPRHHDAICQSGTAPLVLLRESEEGTNDRCPPMNRSTSEAVLMNLLSQKVVHLRHSERSEPQTGGVNVREKLVESAIVIVDRGVRQPA